MQGVSLSLGKRNEKVDRPAEMGQVEIKLASLFD